MPDLGPVVGALGEIMAPLVKRALGAFLVTTFGMVTLSIAAGVSCYFIASEGSALRGAVAVVIALVAFTILGVMLSVKRAIGSALIEGFARLALGAKTAHVLFARILQVDPNAQFGQRGVAVARVAERVPLAEAEARLREAVDWVLSARDGVKLGFFRRKIREAAVKRVSALTLARFRQEGQQTGGVDLVRVRDEMAAKVDETIAGMIRGALLKVTLALVLVACVVSVGGAFGLRAVWK